MATRKVSTIPHVLRNMVVVEKLDQIEPKLAAVEGDIRKLRGFGLSGAFGFEKAQTAGPLEALRKEKVHLEMARLGYPEVDYSFLSWRKKNTRLPAFMVLDLKSNTFTLSASTFYRDYTHVRPQVPTAVENMYEKAWEHLERRYGWESSITAEFNGVMPDEVRQKTRQASPRFNQIFLVVEAPDWKIKNIMVAKDDPLVVGWTNKTDQMFLIAAFDPTELEKYVQTQHTF